MIMNFFNYVAENTCVLLSLLLAGLLCKFYFVNLFNEYIRHAAMSYDMALFELLPNSLRSLKRGNAINISVF